MTDKWLSELMGGDSWGWRGRAENSTGATTPPDNGDDGAEKQRREGKSNGQTEAKWCLSGSAFFCVCNVKHTDASACICTTEAEVKETHTADTEKIQTPSNPNSLLTALSQVSSYCVLSQ